MTDHNNNNLNLLRCLVTFIQGSGLLENQSQNIQLSFNAFAGSVTQQCSSSGYTSMPVVNTGYHIPMMSTNVQLPPSLLEIMNANSVLVKNYVDTYDKCDDKNNGESALTRACIGVSKGSTWSWDKCFDIYTKKDSGVYSRPGGFRPVMESVIEFIKIRNSISKEQRSILAQELSRQLVNATDDAIATPYD